MDPTTLQQTLELMDEIRSLSFQLDDCSAELVLQRQRVEKLAAQVREMGSLTTVAGDGLTKVDRVIDKMKSLMDR